MRILGIDLGSTSIKAVEIDSAFGRFEIHDYHEHPIETGEGPELAINRLLQSLLKKPDRIAVALPMGQLTFRNLRVPTRDRKEIQATIGFELEDELPFPIEKSVYDYSVLSQSKQGTEVHVATTLRAHLESALQTWLSAGINPDTITSESWAYRTLLNRTLPMTDQSEPVLLAQIGSDRTTLYVHWRGVPVLAREIAWGGQDLTQAIAQKYNLPLDQAERAKLDHGFVVAPSQKTEITPDQAEFSETLMGPIRELISAFRQAEFTCKGITHLSLSRIYLAGGTSLLPGLSKVIEESFSIPARPLRGLSSLASSGGVNYSDHSDAAFLLAAGIALSMVGADRASLINFRTGEFSKKNPSRELSLTQLKKPLLATSLILASMILSLSLQLSTYRSKIEDTHVQLEKAMKSFFGSISGSAIRTYLVNTNSLKSNINKELNKQREIVKITSPNSRSPLDVLKNLSTTLPRDVVVDLIDFQTGAAPKDANTTNSDSSNITLTFKFNDPQTAERLSGLLGSKINKLQKGKPEEMTNPDGSKSWKVTFSGKPSEEAYGK